MIVSSTRTVSIVRHRLFVPVIGAYTIMRQSVSPVRKTSIA